MRTGLNILLAAVAIAPSAMPARAAPAVTVTHKSTAQTTRDSRPNIVVILADDMGFSDLGSYGGEIPTPNLDALAAHGLRFTQFYNAARCSPSRASLLTGLYPHEAGVGHLEETVVPGSRGLRGRLDERAVTLGEVLKQAGYFTAMSGKWHVGNTHGVGPWNRGFDRSITPPLGGLYFPNQTSKNRTTVYIDGRQVPTASPEVGTGHWYASDMFVDWGVRFVQESGEKRKPFFLYLPFTAPHFPLMAPPEDIARFRGSYAAGWDKLRDARFARQKSLGIIDARARLPARLPDTFDWDKLSPDDRARFERIMEIYAADVFRMDQAIGTLVAALKRSGEFDNTLILFMADNGGNAESGPWGRADGDDLGGPQSNVFAGMNWATLQNTPFAFFKHFTREGGIASPLIASWPEGIARRLNGDIVHTPAHLVDIMPTLIGVGRARYPSVYQGHAILPMDGVSIAPAFTGKKIARRGPILWEHEGNRAIRHGRWKAVKRFDGPWVLYDISRDRTETDDLSACRPQVVRRLSAQWDQWAEKSHVDPWLEAYDRGLAGTRQDWGGGRGELTKK